ncbi:MAG TPA: hypothetical protein VIK91_26560 [Nannocystis sp.]
MRWGVLAISCVTGLGCCPGGEGSLDAVLDEPFHREGMVDAANLMLQRDGVLRWRIFGCDFDSRGQAAWIREGERAVVEPAPGETLDWIGDFGGLSEVIRMTLTPLGTGEALAVHLTFAGDEPSVTQVWIRGGVCAVCGGGLGPTGQEPCDDPFGE